MPPFQAIHLITSLNGGGTENFLWQVLSHSPSDVSHRVLYLKEDGVIGEKIRALGISVERSPGPIALVRKLMILRPDALHTLLFRAHQIGRVAGAMAKVPRIISSQRSIDAWARPWQVAIDRGTLRSTDVVLVNSSAAERIVTERKSGRPKPLVRRIINGVDLAPLTPDERRTARAAFKIPENAIVGASLMRLHAEKGADLLPAFAREALTGNPNLYLIISGTGPLESDLRSQTENQAWSSRLLWIGWKSSPREVLAAADFSFILSREESFPQALLEASALGLPWLAPEVGGVGDLLQEGAVGLLFRGIDGSKTALARLLGDLPSLSASAQKRASTVADKFSLEKMVRIFYAALRGG